MLINYWKSICVAVLASSAVAIPVLAAGDTAGRDTIAVDARLGQSVLRHGRAQRVFLRIGVRGIRGEDDGNRTPANVALVIDRSGSMRGSKIARARDAASMAINRLSATDIASVIVFDNRIDTIVTATRVDDPDEFHYQIERVRVGGNTAIYAAVEEAAREIRRNKSRRHLNRIVLMSDGKANVGPAKPYHFEELGRELGGEGISVTTIGLGDGYNEDLMSELASTSDGNHAFARSAADLTKIFNQEFDDVLSVTGQDVEIIIRTRSGVKPIRFWGRDGRISGDVARIKLNQVYGTAEYSLQLELDVPGGLPVGAVSIVDIEVDYTPSKGKRRRIARSVSGRFSRSGDEAERSIDPRVMEPILELQARKRSRKAIKLRDEGRVEEAREVLKDNADQLSAGQRRYGIKSKRLQRLQRSNEAAAATIADREQWSRSRKQMRENLSNRQGAKLKY